MSEEHIIDLLQRVTSLEDRVRALEVKTTPEEDEKTSLDSIMERGGSIIGTAKTGIFNSASSLLSKASNALKTEETK